MSTFGEGSQGGEETAAPAAGGDQQQQMDSFLLGRPKCYSGREDEWHDRSLKFGATTATLSDHASVWTSGALELSLDQPDQAAALIFARQMYTLLVHLREERALAIVRGAPDHNGLEAWSPLHEWYQPNRRSRGLALLNEILGWDFGTQGTAAYEGLGECDAGVQQNCKCATTGRGAVGCVDFSISEGSPDTRACASAGGNGEVEPCATVSL